MGVAKRFPSHFRKRNLALLAIFWGLAVSFGGYFVLWPGTEISGVSLGLMTPRRAEEELKTFFEKNGDEIEFYGDSFSFKVKAKDLGIYPDYSSSVAEARRPVWEMRVKKYPLVFLVDEDLFSAKFLEVDEVLRKAPRDARFKLTEGKTVSVDPHLFGRGLNKEEFRRIFLERAGQTFLPKRVEMPFVALDPLVFSSDLENYLPLEIVSRYSTNFTYGNDRAHNIGLACDKFKELTVWPGQVFSFNEITGPRIFEVGYKKAPIIVEGRLEDDYGGGVCQVSTTVYVAALKAGFEIIERHNHGLPVSYVPLGLDATVSYGYLDLKMQNPHDAPYIICARAFEGVLDVCVFGKFEGSTMVVESAVLKEYPPQKYVNGEETSQKDLRSGYLVETVRKTLVDGFVVKVEHLNTSMYPPEESSGH